MKMSRIETCNRAEGGRLLNLITSVDADSRFVQLSNVIQPLVPTTSSKAMNSDFVPSRPTRRAMHKLDGGIIRKRARCSVEEY